MANRTPVGTAPTPPGFTCSKVGVPWPLNAHLLLKPGRRPSNAPAAADRRGRGSTAPPARRASSRDGHPRDTPPAGAGAPAARPVSTNYVARGTFTPAAAPLAEEDPPTAPRDGRRRERLQARVVVRSAPPGSASRCRALTGTAGSACWPRLRARTRCRRSSASCRAPRPSRVRRPGLQGGPASQPAPAAPTPQPRRHRPGTGPTAPGPGSGAAAGRCASPGPGPPPHAPASAPARSPPTPRTARRAARPPGRPRRAGPAGRRSRSRRHTGQQADQRRHAPSTAHGYRVLQGAPRCPVRTAVVQVGLARPGRRPRSAG